MRRFVNAITAAGRNVRSRFVSGFRAVSRAVGRRSAS